MAKIYFAAPMLGDRRGLDLAREILEGLKNRGHSILTEHVVEEVLDLERGMTPEEIFERDISLMDEADVLVAEVSYPSLGVGFEIAYMLLREKPVLAFAVSERIEKVSALIRGISWKNFVFKSYDSPSEAVEAVEAFLNGIL